MRLLFLERDIDKALRRMALEEEKNLTETVNDILWKGLKDYLKQTGKNHVLHKKGMFRHFVPPRWLHPLAPLKRLSPVDLPSANSIKCCSPPASLKKKHKALEVLI